LLDWVFGTGANAVPVHSKPRTAPLEGKKDAPAIGRWQAGACPTGYNPFVREDHMAKDRSPKKEVKKPKKKK
jgi:hypothetical protein